MKKLLAAGCCVMALQSFSQVNLTSGSSTSDGKRVLLKAIAGIVNNEANRKLPQKLANIPKNASPDL